MTGAASIPARAPRGAATVACIALVAVLAGCGGGSGVERGGADPAPAVHLTKIPFEAWQAELDRRRGQVVVVDFWASWCVPCLERFPHLVELHERYAPRGVAVLTVALDDPEDPDAVAFVEDFLARQRATFPNFLIDGPVPRSFEKLDLLGIPAVFVYDRAGNLAARLTGDDPDAQFTDEDVERAVAALVDGGPAAG